jgi:hypothetical protein
MHIMQVTDENISNFQALYKKIYGIDLTKDAAYEKAMSILNLMQLIHKPISKSQLIKLKPYLLEWESEIEALLVK